MSARSRARPNLLLDTLSHDPERFWREMVGGGFPREHTTHVPAFPSPPPDQRPRPY